MLIKRNPPPQPENYRLLPVGRASFCLVDPDTYENTKKHYYRLIKSSHVTYVARRYVKDGKTYTIRLHTEIMQPPPGYEVHHGDRNPLNCLRTNLENVTPSEHRRLHGKAY